MMPTLQEFQDNLFNHFDYASNLKKKIETMFPKLETVDFEPLQPDGTPTAYADLPIPAFLMAFGDPDFENLSMMQPMLDTSADFDLYRGIADSDGERAEIDALEQGASYVNLRIRVHGTLFLPVLPNENDSLKGHVKNIAIYHAEVNACLVAFLKTQIVGDGVIDTIVESIETGVEIDADQNALYRTTEFIWSHEVVVGFTGDEFGLDQLFMGIEGQTIELPIGGTQDE